MNPIDAARVRLEQAAGLPAVIDAACDAFEQMLRAIEDQQDPTGEAFVAFVMSGAAAANGRDALAAAPSLPPAASAELADAVAESPHDVTSEDASASLATLSHLVARRLADASDLTAEVGDRVALAHAARHAASICSLLGGVTKP